MEHWNMHNKCSSLAHLQLASVLQYFLSGGNYADAAIKVKSDTEQHNDTSVPIIATIDYDPYKTPEVSNTAKML